MHPSTQKVYEIVLIYKYKKKYNKSRQYIKVYRECPEQEIKKIDY